MEAFNKTNSTINNTTNNTINNKINKSASNLQDFANAEAEKTPIL